MSLAPQSLYGTEKKRNIRKGHLYKAVPFVPVEVPNVFFQKSLEQYINSMSLPSYRI